MIIKFTIPELSKIAKRLNLQIKITEEIIKIIRDLHFTKGISIPEMRKKLKDKFLELGWFNNGRPKKDLSNFILNILGYEDWEAYKLNRSNIYKESVLNLPRQFDLKTAQGLSDFAKSMDLDITITPEIIEKIKALHFQQGASIQKITVELKDELERLGWIQENIVRLEKYSRTLQPQLKKKVPKFMIFLLGYENLESYKEGQLKLYLKASTKRRYQSGFDNKLKKEIIEKNGGKCVICESTENIEVHHIDNNCENNEVANLTILCDKCHKKIRKGFVYYDYNHNCFIEYPFYKIWKEKNTIKIKSCYDQKLNMIIKSINRFYRDWNTEEKIWIVEQDSFKRIQDKIIEYITSTGRKYEFPD